MALKKILIVYFSYLLISCNKSESISIKIVYSITDTFANITIDNESTQIDSIKINNDKLILDNNIKKQKLDIYPIYTFNRFKLFFKDTTILKTLIYDITKKFELIPNREFTFKVSNPDTLKYTYQIIDIISNKIIAENSKELKSGLLIIDELTDKTGKFTLNISWTKNLYLTHYNTTVDIELTGKSQPIEIETKPSPNMRFGVMSAD